MSWTRACSTDDVEPEDVIRFDHDGRVYAIYRSPEGDFHASDGICTHERTCLADGLVMGSIIECPKHNGRFNYKTGKAQGAPLTVDITTYPVNVVDGQVFVDLKR
jgi:3-phenylpropionate/trans-cinnamate dioxygenase ferredoxin subunit